MVKHGDLTKLHVYDMLRSKEARVRRAAFTLLEISNPSLRRDSGVFMEITRFIWDANPSYDVFREFNERHLLVRHKVHELISARFELEKKEKQRAATNRFTNNTNRYRFFRRLLSSLSIRTVRVNRYR
jgi:hypothetical protein